MKIVGVYINNIHIVGWEQERPTYLGSARKNFISGAPCVDIEPRWDVLTSPNDIMSLF